MLLFLQFSTEEKANFLPKSILVGGLGIQNITIGIPVCLQNLSCTQYGIGGIAWDRDNTTAGGGAV